MLAHLLLQLSCPCRRVQLCNPNPSFVDYHACCVTHGATTRCQEEKEEEEEEEEKEEGVAYTPRSCKGLYAAAVQMGRYYQLFPSIMNVIMFEKRPAVRRLD
eukprot:1141159-Pelagomonas_calceolata.AAC.2